MGWLLMISVGGKSITKEVERQNARVARESALEFDSECGWPVVDVLAHRRRARGARGRGYVDGEGGRGTAERAGSGLVGRHRARGRHADGRVRELAERDRDLCERGALRDLADESAIDAAG
jgi:hypothetical protein